MISGRCMSLRMVHFTLLALRCACQAISEVCVAGVGSRQGLFFVATKGQINSGSEIFVREKMSVSGAAQPPRRTNYEETDKFWCM